MNDEDLKFAVVALSAVFFVIDPLANVPLFLTITTGLSPVQRKRVALRLEPGQSAAMMAAVRRLKARRRARSLP